MADDRCGLLCLDLEKAEVLRQRRLDATAERLAGQAKALSDPTRLTIAAALADGGELGVCDIAWVTERPENLVSYPPAPAPLASSLHQSSRGQDGDVRAHRPRPGAVRGHHGR
jgi:DNA-binding transcriptional ArsR family regulator